MPQPRSKSRYVKITSKTISNERSAKETPIRDWMTLYVEHIRGCDLCWQSITFHFMTEPEMTDAIIVTHFEEN